MVFKEGLVSVIVPVYNMEKYLEKCLCSILSQSYSKLDIIIVDDGSTDGSLAICNEFAMRDNRIRVIKKANGGLSSARNEGLRYIKGEFCYFCDSDDFLFDDTIQVCVNNIGDSELLIFGYVKRDVDGNAIDLYELNDEHIDISKMDNKYSFIYDRLLNYDICWEAWNKLFKTETIFKNDLTFIDNDEIFAEDLLFALYYITKIDKIICISDILYNYVVRYNSIMNTSNQVTLNKYAILAKKYYDFLELNRYKFIQEKFHNIYFAILFNYFTTFKKEIKPIYFRAIQDICFFKINLLPYRKSPLILVSDKRKRLLISALSLDSSLSFTYNLILKYKKRIKLRKGFESKCVYLIGTEDFGNIGDHKIALAELEYLRNHFNGYEIIEIPASKTYETIGFLKNEINDDDLIFLTGGGNFGNLYGFSERLRRTIVNTFPKNRIIMFPQSICFTNNRQGSIELDITRNILNEHQRLYLMLRDEASYQIAERKFDNAYIYLCPDIVLTQRNVKNKNYKKKNRICINLRKDKESNITFKDHSVLDKMLQREKYILSYINHQLDYNISIEKRYKIVDGFLKIYGSVDLVITDRLHGMIFSIISNTPCIVLDNNNKKITGVYAIMKNCESVKFVSNVNEITTNLVDKMQNVNVTFDNCIYVDCVDTILRSCLEDG